MMVDVVHARLRDRPVEAELEDIKTLLDREHGPVITEVRRRLNELIAALNPGNVVATAGAASGYLEITVGGTAYSIPLYARA